MFRHRIAADENTDVDALVADLRLRLDRTQLPPERRALALAEATAVLSEFVVNGRKLAALGSRFSASRVISGEGYAVTLAFSPGASKGWLSRLLGR